MQEACLLYISTVYHCSATIHINFPNRSSYYGIAVLHTTTNRQTWKHGVVLPLYIFFRTLVPVYGKPASKIFFHQGVAPTTVLDPFHIIQLLSETLFFLLTTLFIFFFQD